MKKSIFLVFAFVAVQVQAQQNINDLLVAGINDAERFTKSYFTPVSEGAMHSITNGWYNSAEVLKPGRFQVTVVANASLVSEDQSYFTMNIEDYEYIQFQNQSSQKRVATALGQNDPDVVVYVEYETLAGTQQQNITLPDGFGEMPVKAIPNAFLQAGVGVFKGTEIKARFVPSIDYDGAKTNFYGGGLQHEFTSWIPGADVLPIAVSGVIGFTHLDASYDFTEEGFVDGENQRIETDMNAWLFSAVVSTKLPVINFYAGLGYVTGKADTNLKGTYTVQTGILQNETVVDPFGFQNDISGIKANLGFNLSLGFFRFFADYSFQEYQNVSVGLGFKI